MEQHLSWRKAYIVSAAIHVVIFLLLAVGLAAVVAKQEQQVYEIDLQASDFSQGSGHEGGGSAESLFPEPLKAEEVAKRVETVQQKMEVQFHPERWRPYLLVKSLGAWAAALSQRALQPPPPSAAPGRDFRNCRCPHVRCLD